MRLPKNKAAWKKLQATSIRHALRLNKEYAREFKRLTVPAIAELMTITDERLYKWLSTGDMPVSFIPAYEHICGIDFVTQYLGIRDDKILIDLPKGKKATDTEIAKLQKLSGLAITQLVSIYEDDEEADLDKTIATLTQLLQGVAYHRENINTQPELDFEDGEQE
jgi:hypothetical protein